MMGLGITFTDIQSALTSFWSIPAVVPILSAVVALGLVPVVVNALYSTIGRRR